MGPSDTDGSTNKIPGTGVGTSVGVERRVDVGIGVWVGMTVAVEVTGAGAGTEGAQAARISIRMVMAGSRYMIVL